MTVATTQASGIQPLGRSTGLTTPPPNRRRPVDLLQKVDIDQPLQWGSAGVVQVDQRRDEDVRNTIAFDNATHGTAPVEAAVGERRLQIWPALPNQSADAWRRQAFDRLVYQGRRE